MDRKPLGLYCSIKRKKLGFWKPSKAKPASFFETSLRVYYVSLSFLPSLTGIVRRLGSFSSALGLLFSFSLLLPNALMPASQSLFQRYDHRLFLSFFLPSFLSLWLPFFYILISETSLPPLLPLLFQAAKALGCYLTETNVFLALLNPTLFHSKWHPKRRRILLSLRSNDVQRNNLTARIQHRVIVGWAFFRN